MIPQYGMNYGYPQQQQAYGYPQQQSYGYPQQQAYGPVQQSYGYGGPTLYGNASPYGLYGQNPSMTLSESPYARLTNQTTQFSTTAIPNLSAYQQSMFIDMNGFMGNTSGIPHYPSFIGSTSMQNSQTPLYSTYQQYQQQNPTQSQNIFGMQPQVQMIGAPQYQQQGYFQPVQQFQQQGYFQPVQQFQQQGVQQQGGNVAGNITGLIMQAISSIIGMLQGSLGQPQATAQVAAPPQYHGSPFAQETQYEAAHKEPAVKAPKVKNNYNKAKETTEIKETADAKENTKTTETIKVKETEEAKETIKTTEIKEIAEAKVPETTEEAKEIAKVEETKETIKTVEAKVPETTEEVKETTEAKAPEKTEEVKETTETKASEKSEEAKESRKQNKNNKPKIKIVIKNR